MPETFMTDFKRFFIRGLTVVLPTLLTLMIILYVIGFINEYIGQYIVIGLAYSLSPLLDAPPGELVLTMQRWFWWVGLLLAIAGIYIIGRLVASWLGRKVWRTVEGWLLGMPIIKQIYPSVKQVTDFLLAERKMEFSRVVAVQYPRKGVWSVGLVTAPGMRSLHCELGGDLVTVFVPSSPTPFTGYTITVRRDEVVDLPMSIDEALRFTISGGVIMPPVEKMTESELKKARRGVLPPPRKKEVRV